jgi:hypothetical protein
MHPHHRLEDLGRNLASLTQTGTVIALTLIEAGLTLPGLAGGVLFGERRRRECDCGVRHHYRCCNEPPIYGCGG